MVNEETILVRIINKVEGAEELIKEKNLIGTLTKDNGDLTKTYEEQTATQRKRVTITEKTNAQGKKQVSVNKEVLAQGPKFQLHFLGIMFGGMALNRAMSNLTATSKEWVGIGELMATTMGVVMLPATLELLDKAVLPLMDALIGLPEDTKLKIGVTILGLEGLGKLLEVIGQVALFKIAFPAAFPAAIAALKTSLAATIGSGILVAVGVILAWKSIEFLREGIEEGSLIKEIMGILGLATGLGAIGFAFLGPVGGAIGFGLGISIGLTIDWFIRQGGFAEGLQEIGDFAQSKFGGLISLAGGTRTRAAAIGAGFLGDFLSGGQSISNTNTFAQESTGGFFSNLNTSNNQAGNTSIVYNVNVSDKSEFEKMLQRQSQLIVREVRRNATV